MDSFSFVLLLTWSAWTYRFSVTSNISSIDISNWNNLTLSISGLRLYLDGSSTTTTYSANVPKDISANSLAKIEYAYTFGGNTTNPHGEGNTISCTVTLSK